ncbi:MAG: ATP-dependent DNA helicase RecG [bacterium]|nr:ATP-dependent DNA helicase RecG [bacterium]
MIPSTDLSTPISKLFMVGPTYARRLSKLGIETIEDLLHHYPFRYEDFSVILKISKVRPGEIVTLKAKVHSIKNEYTKNGKKLQKAVIFDEGGSLEIIWFNQPFLTRVIKAGERYFFSGKIDWFGRKLTMISPEYEQEKELMIHTGRLVPVYPETYGISSKWLRSRIAPLLRCMLPSIIDYLPNNITQTHNLPNLADSLLRIHFPESDDQIEKAKRRLSFDELFLTQLATLSRKEAWKKKTLARELAIDQDKILKFFSRLPFQLTSAQKRCIQEILADLGKKQPMNRLLEGDVGSGKTVVAATAIYVAYLNGCKSAIMAPTEILANQHFQTLSQLLSPFGINISLLTGSHKTKKIEDQGPDVWVGTHALLFADLDMDKLSFVVIDEQHRFGVEQRAKLANTAKSPHLLTMTATPIPRTMALTLYGDLDLSVLDEMPEGRRRVKTWVVPPYKREAAYNWIREHVKGTDEQAFIVCPLIEESETLTTVKAVKAEFEKLSNKIFPDLRLGLLHGKLKSKEKDEVIKKFREGEVDVLVSTPVVEVGIDIPQATIMMIEEAQRFGLAQLHQLRGRVGRGTKESYCLLFASTDEGKFLVRLKAMEKSNIGMDLAEIDFKIRGPGEIYGTAQHGFPHLKIASYTDLELTQETRLAANEVLRELNKYPVLSEKLKRFITKAVAPN